MLKKQKNHITNKTLALCISIITFITTYNIWHILNYEPNKIWYVDLHYWFALALVIFLLPLKTIINGQGKLIRKFFLSCTCAVFIGMTTLFLSAITPNFLTNLSQNGAFMTDEEQFFYQQLKGISTLKHAKGNLKDITNFEWDHVEAFHGYSPTQKATYLAFYRNNKLVTIIKGYQPLFKNEISQDGGYIEFIDHPSNKKNVRYKMTFKQHDYPSGYNLKVYSMTLR